MRLCLIRHFEPAVAPGVCYGQSDLALQTPIADVPLRVEKLRAALTQRAMDRAPMFSSPLRRCRALAEVLSSHVLEDLRLRELNFGDWEMQSWESIGAQALDAWAEDLTGFRPPAGETGHELQQRALGWLRDVSHDHDAVVAVTHAGIMRALQAHHQRLPGSEWLNLRYAYGEMMYLDFDHGQIHAAPVQ